jgi:hypothetical protein
MLPNADHAIVDQGKIVAYLINATHPDNGGKARFFFNLGFSIDQWELLQAALRTLAVRGAVVQTSQTVHGDKFVVDGGITTPSGKMAEVRSVWIIDHGTKNPRLVTAYPRA